MNEELEIRPEGFLPLSVVSNHEYLNTNYIISDLSYIT